MEKENLEMFFSSHLTTMVPGRCFIHQEQYCYLNPFLDELGLLERQWVFLQLLDMFFDLNTSVLISFFVLYLYNYSILLVLYQYFISAISVLYL